MSVKYRIGAETTSPARADVCFWHKADIELSPGNVRFTPDCVAKLGWIYQPGVVCIFAVPCSAVPMRELRHRRIGTNA
jgi:hypothetical protein